MPKLPFSVNQAELSSSSKPDIQGKIQTIDNSQLFYAACTPNQPDHCIIFYHGGGANHLSYTRMAECLRDTSNAATFLFDIRGHGQSDGARGYCKSKEIVWSDINSAIQFVKLQYPNTPIYLGGHSCSKTLAVKFNYPEELIHELGFVPGYNVSMAEAVTPDKPIEALSNLDKPLFICLAAEDEIINNEALQKVLSPLQKENASIQIEKIPDAKHIMIIKDAPEYIKKHLKSVNQSADVD